MNKVPVASIVVIDPDNIEIPNSSKDSYILGILSECFECT